MDTKRKRLMMIMSTTMMRRTVSTLAAILVLTAAATTAQAAVTVTRVGADLYVVGDAADDSVLIENWSSSVCVLGTYYRNVAIVSVDMGQGNDGVHIWADHSTCSIDVSTGNGEDYVWAETYASDIYDNTITIDTGNADDDVLLTCYGYSSNFQPLDVALGRGDDSVCGYAYCCDGTIDGGKGYDSCSGLILIGGSASVVNCED